MSESRNYLIPAISCAQCCVQYDAYSRPVFYVSDKGRLSFKPRLFKDAVPAEPENIVEVIRYVKGQAIDKAGWQRTSEGLICRECSERVECEECGVDIQPSWFYCPYCGKQQPEREDD